MEEIKQDSPDLPINAPIPGQSLTAPLGDRPWQKPARYSTPDQALAFYVDRITKPKRASELLDILENGVPADTLVDIIQQGGVMEGIHSLDVGIIIAPALVELVSNMAEAVGSDYVKFSQGTDEKQASSAEVVFALNEDLEEALLSEDVVEKEEKEEPKGLMARRTE